MRITFGNVTIEGADTEELDICLEYLETLSNRTVPAPTIQTRTITTSTLTGKDAETIELEARWKAATGNSNFRVETKGPNAGLPRIEQLRTKVAQAEAIKAAGGNAASLDAAPATVPEVPQTASVF